MNVNFEIYPLQFKPIFKERIWGGEKLKTILGKPINSNLTGESWELSTVENNISFIANGEYKDVLFTEILEKWPIQILGNKVYDKFGTQFPLLFKYLDAKEDLSIQVHPNDDLALKNHNSFGKTEMWYIMQADENARVILGFKENSNRDQYLEELKNKRLVSLLDEKKVKKGDVYFLETGTIHAIGAGILLAEIQQTSDITYRVYDWDRVDAQGKSRDLHLDLALDAMNYSLLETQINYNKVTNVNNEVVNCPYFITKFLPLNGNITIDKNNETFLVYMCVDGVFKLEYNEVIYEYKKGDTILIPAAMSSYKLIGEASLLEICI